MKLPRKGTPRPSCSRPGLLCGVLTVNWSPPLVSRRGPCSGTARPQGSPSHPPCHPTQGCRCPEGHAGTPFIPEAQVPLGGPSMSSSGRRGTRRRLAPQPQLLPAWEPLAAAQADSLGGRQLGSPNHCHMVAVKPHLSLSIVCINNNKKTLPPSCGTRMSQGPLTAICRERSERGHFSRT